MAKQQRRAGIRRLHQDLLLLLLLGKLKSRSVVGIGSCIGMGVGVGAGIGIVAVVGLAAIAVQVAHHGHLELSRGFPGFEH